MLVNLNNTARFILTPAGEQVIRERYGMLSREYNERARSKPLLFDWFRDHPTLDEHGTREEQLWVLMQIFGEKMQGFADVFFKDNVLDIQSNDDVEREHQELMERVRQAQA